MRDFINNPNFKYILISIGALLTAFILSKILRAIITKFLNSSTTHLNVDSTKYNFLKNAISFILFISAFIFIFFTVPKLRALGVTLFAGAGVLTAIVLFASQAAFSNIISGIFIIIFKPFRVGDIIKIGNLSNGKIEDITLRHTVIRNFENRRIIIPNSVISSETIINSTIMDEMICNFIEFGISYDSNIDKAMKIITDEVVKHPDYIDNRTKEEQKEQKPPVTIRVIGYGDSSINLRAYVWSKDHSTGFIMKCDLFKSVKEKFDKEGIEIPFPYRTIVYKKDIENTENK